MKFDPSELQELAKAVSKLMVEELRPLLPKTGQVVDNLLSVKGIANHLDISITKIYTLVKKNGIPHKKVGRDIRFDCKEVDAYFDSKKGVAHEET